MITHILKAICVICTAACAAGAFVSCGDASGSSVRDASSTPANVTSGDTSATDLTAAEFMEKALSQAPDSLLDTTTAKGDTSDYGFDKFCKKLYGGTLPDDLEDGAISYASSGGNADEAVLVPEFSFDLKTSPMLFIHGDADGWAAMNSVKTWEKMRAMGIQSELHTLALRNHCFQRTAAPGTGSYTWLDRIGEYLDNILK